MNFDLQTLGQFIAQVGGPVAGLWVIWKSFVARIDSNEKSSSEREAAMAKRIGSLEDEFRNDLTDLVRQQGDVIRECTTVIRECTKVMNDSHSVIQSIRGK
jgi:hypothetical protein